MPSSDHDRVVQAVMQLPEYQQLIKRRNRASLGFFAATLIIYAGFILTLAFDPDLFARPLAPSLTMSVGVLAGTVVTASAVVLVALYVRLSNKVFDPLLEAIARKTS